MPPPAAGRLTGPLIAAEAITVHAGRRAVLEDVAIEVRAGEIVTLIGPNGAGKTTLIRVLLGSIEPAEGRVNRAHGVRIGYVPQRVSADPVLPLTVGRFLRLGRRVAAAEIETVLEEVGAARLARQLLHELSGGELQRVLLARALLRRPDLLILDEPVQGVDFSGQLDLYELIARLRAEHGCGMLIVSHDLHVVMAATDRVVCLNRHVCCSGLPEAVTRDPAFVELFGRRAAADLALYSHAHDHRHDLAGEVVAIEGSQRPHTHSH